VSHGLVVIAAITSCTNTSNPSVMLGAGTYCCLVGYLMQLIQVVKWLDAGPDSLVLSVMLYGAESWPLSAQMNQLINSFATSVYHVMTGVKRLDKVRNTTVLTSVSRNELIHTVDDRQLRFLGHMLRNTLSTCQYLCAIPANSWHNKTWLSSTKLRGLHREADWNEDRRTRGGVRRP